MKVFEMIYEPDPDPTIDSPPERRLVSFDFDNHPDGLSDAELDALDAEVDRVKSRTMAAIRSREKARRARAARRNSGA